MELLPLKATFSPKESIEIELRGAQAPTEIALWHLDRRLDAKRTEHDEIVRFQPQPVGGYGVDADGAQTAFDVLDDPLDRPRYGFVSHYEAGRETAGVVDNIRRLHLNATQFYDWMYRHAQLLPREEEFTDALGRRISLNTVRRLAKAVREAGSLPMGYAAVYAIGREHWDEWRGDGLYRADGSPWTLGDDFLTWATAGTNQDATYIEVWAPHDRLAHLAELVSKAKSMARDKPVILAAYLSTYARDERAGTAAEELQLATVFSHGGTVLLHGEEDAALTEAYYVAHKRLGRESQATARRYFDFAVRYGDLLFDPTAVDVTRTHTGGQNHEVRIKAPVRTATDCEAGTLWTRVVHTSRGLIISLIDLSSQDDELWDAPKATSQVLSGVELFVERSAASAPLFLFAAPNDAPRLRPLDAELDGNHDQVAVPPFRTWALVWVREV